MDESFKPHVGMFVRFKNPYMCYKIGDTDVITRVSSYTFSLSRTKGTWAPYTRDFEIITPPAFSDLKYKELYE